MKRSALSRALRRLSRFRFVDLRLQRAVDRAVAWLSCPRGPLPASDVSDLRRLKVRLKQGDVLLVCGNARISYVVKFLTLSPWSHVVMYVGDRSDLLSENERKEWQALFGEASLRHLVIDADPVHRVHLRPLDDFAGLMLRHCRAEALTEDDNDAVVSYALSELGKDYDVGHIMRLLVFFAFPWDLLPESLRRLVTDFTLSERDTICSRVIAEAFHSVNYPIRPQLVLQNRSTMHNKALGFALGLTRRSRTAAKLLMGGRLGAAFQRLTSEHYAEIHFRGTRHVTPSDYDLSRFFSVVKDDDDLSIRYRDARAVCLLPD